MDLSGTPTEGTQVVDFGTLYISEMENVPPPPPAPISIADLLSSVEVITQKEAEDKATLEAIGAMTTSALKSKLTEWAIAKFPNNFEIHRLTLIPPEKCSDGVTRDLTDYIQFCSGKSFQQHIDPLRAKVSGMSFTFANMGSHIAIFATMA